VTRNDTIRRYHRWVIRDLGAWWCSYCGVRRQELTEMPINAHWPLCAKVGA
jgi:hypothetical protein